MEELSQVQVRQYRAAVEHDHRENTHRAYVIESICFSQMEEHSGYDTVRLWNTNRTTSEIVGHTYELTNVCFSPDGKIIASARDDTVRLWNATTGQHIRTITGHTSLVEQCMFLTGRKNYRKRKFRRYRAYCGIRPQDNI